MLNFRSTTSFDFFLELLCMSKKLEFFLWQSLSAVNPGLTVSRIEFGASTIEYNRRLCLQ